MNKKRRTYNTTSKIIIKPLELRPCDTIEGADKLNNDKE